MKKIKKLLSLVLVCAVVLTSAVCVSAASISQGYIYDDFSAYADNTDNITAANYTTNVTASGFKFVVQEPTNNLRWRANLNTTSMFTYYEENNAVFGKPALCFRSSGAAKTYGYPRYVEASTNNSSDIVLNRTLKSVSYKMMNYAVGVSCAVFLTGEYVNTYPYALGFAYNGVTKAPVGAKVYGKDGSLKSTLTEETALSVARPYFAVGGYNHDAIVMYCDEIQLDYNKDVAQCDVSFDGNTISWTVTITNAEGKNDSWSGSYTDSGVSAALAANSRIGAAFVRVGYDDVDLTKNSGMAVTDVKIEYYEGDDAAVVKNADNDYSYVIKPSTLGLESGNVNVILAHYGQNDMLTGIDTNTVDSQIASVVNTRFSKPANTTKTKLYIWKGDLSDCMPATGAEDITLKLN